MTALGSKMAGRAASLEAWFLHDPDPWGGNHIPHGELRRIADCVARRRDIELFIGHEYQRRVSPLGLVLKAGSWNLVGLEGGVVVVVPIDDLRATRITRNPFEPPEDFDLSDFWKRYAGEMLNRR